MISSRTYFVSGFTLLFLFIRVDVGTTLFLDKPHLVLIHFQSYSFICASFKRMHFDIEIYVYILCIDLYWSKLPDSSWDLQPVDNNLFSFTL